MRTQISILLYLIILLLCGCGSDPVTSPTSSTLSNPTTLLLKKKVWETAANTNGSTILYFYNDKNLISEIQRIQWGTGSVNGGPMEIWVDTSYQFFEYDNNNRAIKSIYSDYPLSKGYPSSYREYEYQDELLIKHTVFYPDYRVFEINSYTYDVNNNLIETVTTRHSGEVFKHKMEYTDNGNLKTITRFTLWKNPHKKRKYEYSNFDSGVNFIKAVNGLPITFIWNNNHGSYCSTCPNNYIRSEYYPDVDIDQEYKAPRDYLRTYEYNEEGLPVRLRDGSATVTFEYERYR